jgi:hypothetical protein
VTVASHPIPSTRPWAAGAPSPLRRLPVPVSEPPYDDERTGTATPARPEWDRRTGPAVQGTLALSFVLPSGVPAAPTAPPGLRLVPQPAAQDDADEFDFGPQPTGTASLPPLRRWSAQFAQAVVEVLAGDRPVSQLVRWTTSGVFDDLAGRIDVSPTEPTRGVVRSLHVSQPADGIAEVAASVRRGSRSTALALRLEGLDGRWQCTALELG